VRRVLQVAADLMLQLREVQAQLREARETAGPTIERLVRINSITAFELRDMAVTVFELSSKCGQHINVTQSLDVPSLPHCGRTTAKSTCCATQESELRERCEEASQASASNAALKVRCCGMQDLLR